MTRRSGLIALATLIPVSTALAHGGHGADIHGRSVRHYLTEPEHFIIVLAAAAGLACTVRCVRRLIERAKRDEAPVHVDE